MDRLTIQLSSVPNKENLVAEIWYEETLIAEVSKEHESFEVEVNVSSKKVSKKAFQDAVELAKIKLSY